MCHFNLFIYRSIILYHERISNINYTFSWRIYNILAGDKLASKVALYLGLCFAATIVLLNNFNAGENISVLNQWINKPQVSIALTADGLSLAMLLLTTALTAIILLENEYKKCESILCFNLVHGHLHRLELLATDGLLYYILGTSINTYLFYRFG
jgi:NADH-quinone oxidoreductase subunit M